MTNKWISARDEKEGSTAGRKWVVNQSGESALFKPDTALNESEREYLASKISGFLGIRCAVIEIGERNGRKGCFSFDFRSDRRKRYLDGYDFELAGYADIHFEGLSQINEGVLRCDLIDQIFFDCLTNNLDRHPGNMTFVLDYKKRVLGMAPLYDHGACFGEWSQKSIFTWDGSKEETHLEMLQRAQAADPNRIRQLMQKCCGSNFLPVISGAFQGFLLERIKAMRQLCP